MKKKKEKKHEEPTLSINFLANKREERFREGVWQFLLDHARVLPDGNYQVILTVKNQFHLWMRVNARMEGKYKVNSEEDLKGKKSVTEFAILKRERDKLKKAGEIIYNENRIIGKIVHKIYHLSRKYLMKIV